MEKIMTVIERSKNPGCLIQLLWFALIGWWAGQLWIAIAWVLMVTIIGLPLGIAMINRIPKVVALRETDDVLVSVSPGGKVVTSEQPQFNFLVRALYFLLIGWWLCGVWLEVAYVACATIIGLPLGFWMFDRAPAILTLKR